MRTLSDREKRTVRLGAIGIGIYLLLFFGLQGGKYFSQRRAEYRRVLGQAQSLRRELQPYQDKVLLAQKLMTEFHLDPTKLAPVTVVADASAAVQKAATESGIHLGAIHESGGRASNKELGSIQMEGTGPIPAVLGLLHRVTSLGYPLVVDAVQLHGDPRRPGQITLNMTLVILDFAQWTKKEPSHA